MFYRYEFIPKDGKYDRHLGILTGVDLLFRSNSDIIKGNYDNIINQLFEFEKSLPGPSCDMENTISYFTQKGNRKFHKAINRLCIAINETGVAKTRRIEIDNLDNMEIIYQDKYQVIVKRTEEFW